MTYDNPVYIEQKKRKHEAIDDSGFIVPKKLTDLDMEEEPEISTYNEDDDDWEDDWDDEEEPVMDAPISFKNESPISDTPISFKKEQPQINENKSKDLSSFLDEFENKEREKESDLINFVNTFENSNNSNSNNSGLNSDISFQNSNIEPQNSSSTKKVLKFKL